MAFSIRDELRNKKKLVSKEELFTRAQTRMVALNAMEGVIIPEIRKMAEEKPEENFLNISFHRSEDGVWRLQKGCERSENWLPLNYSDELMREIFSVATAYDIQVTPTAGEERATYVSFWIDLR